MKQILVFCAVLSAAAVVLLISVLILNKIFTSIFYRNFSAHFRLPVALVNQTWVLTFLPEAWTSSTTTVSPMNRKNAFRLETNVFISKRYF